ncbi:MAG: DUF11 domain-containing protein, partial [Actinobacteria bacterium]|nr:DUF11 domain-containing protein [Actinomycetota bacterium]
SAPFTITATVPAGTANGTVLAAAAAVSSAAPADGTPANNTASTTTTVVNPPPPVVPPPPPPPAADMQITISDSADPVAPGATVVYTVTVLNAGPSTVTDAVVTVVVPSGLTFVSAPAGCTFASASSTVTCSVGMLASGSSTQLQIVTAVSPTFSGTLAVPASVVSGVPDPVPANNSDTELTTVIAPVVAPAEAADVGVALVVSPASAVVGNTLVYTATVTNNGPSPAVNVVLTEVLPAGVDFVSASTGCTFDAATRVVTCSLGTLAPGATAVVTITTTAAAVGPATVDVAASVGAATPDPDASNNSASVAATVLAQADVSITKTAAIDGSLITYTIGVANAGASTAVAVTVTDVLPAGVDFVSPGITVGDG